MHTCSTNTFKGTVVNRALQSLLRGSFELYSLKQFFNKETSIVRLLTVYKIVHLTCGVKGYILSQSKPLKQFSNLSLKH